MRLTCQLILKELVVLSYMVYAVAESFVLTRTGYRWPP